MILTSHPIQRIVLIGQREPVEVRLADQVSCRVVLEVLAVPETVRLGDEAVSLVMTFYWGWVRCSSTQINRFECWKRGEERTRPFQGESTCGLGYFFAVSNLVAVGI